MHGLEVLIAAAACLGALLVKEVESQSQTMLADTIQELGLKISKDLHQNDITLTISPLSISSLLSVLMLGSGGQSNRELRHILLPSNSFREEDYNIAFQYLLETFSKTGPGITLSLANGLFLQTGRTIFPDYSLKASTHYKSDAVTLDFQSNAVEATDAINHWVNVSTQGMIPNFYEDPLSSDTTMVAVNTVFFDGKWETSFHPQLTSEYEFDTGSGKIMIPMMKGTLTIDYVNIPELNAKMGAIPYRGGRYAMYIILPKGAVTSNLEPLEQKLTAERINSFIDRMTKLEMRVWLPKMRLTSKVSLKKTLTNLGLGSIFHPATADFSRMSSQPEYVNDILHQTVIEVSEQGTKAAASTGVDGHRSGSSRDLIVNRPAIIFIRDLESGMPIFWTKLVRPERLSGSISRPANAVAPPVRFSTIKPALPRLPPLARPAPDAPVMGDTLGSGSDLAPSRPDSSSSSGASKSSVRIVFPSY